MKKTTEFTPTAFNLGILLAVVFGGANAYLGLRVGMTVSASIPAAVISMGIVRLLLKRDSILENNMVLTIGSAGESLAAGAIFTLPALFMWAKEHGTAMPSFFTIAMLAISGGLLGVLFMVPLRHALLVEAHDRLLACGDAAAGALLEARLEKVPGAEKVYDFGTMSYADAKTRPQIEKRARAKLGGEGDKPEPGRLALARAQAARRIVGTELAVACAERESDHVLVLSTKKGCWLRTVPAADNPGLWLLDMVRRAAAGLPQAEGTGFLPAGQVKQSDPPGRSQSKDPTPKKKHPLRVLLAVLVILALAAFGVAWYLTDGDLAALPQRLKTLHLPEWVTLWQAHEPKPGARLI